MTEHTAKNANPLYGLVLAGGASRRMGRDKALLRQRDGQSQIGYLVALLQPLLERVFVSVRQGQSEEAERRRYAQIIDRHDGIGPLAGILSAMDSYPDADWLVVACDLPNVDATTIRLLLEQRSKQHAQRDAANDATNAAPFIAYHSSHDDLPEPLCAIYSADSAELLRRRIDQGMHCPRKIMLQAQTQLLRQPTPDALDNINTPDDLRASVLVAT